MDFQPLTPPGTHRGSDMALVLSSTPNSFVGIKTSPQKFGLEQDSESSRLFSVNKHNDIDKSGSSPNFNSLPSPLPSMKKCQNIDDLVKENKNMTDTFEKDMSDAEDDDPVECAECNSDFPTLQLFLDHNCINKPENSSKLHDNCRTPSNTSDLSDGESFDGRIVYNPDGSAYILEDGDSSLSDLDSLIGVSDQGELIVDKKGSDTVSQVPALPHIANAIFVPRNPNLDFSRECLPQAPIMFSYKVYDMRTGKNKTDEKSNVKDGDSLSTSEENKDFTNVPTKPILMCFICKLSFGYSKSFIAHAISEHSMVLNEDEKKVMLRKNSSAIIQCVGTKKEPLMSFLEPRPLKTPHGTKSISNMLSSDDTALPNSHKTSPTENTKVSFVHSKPKLSDALIQCSTTKSDATQGSFTPYQYGASSVHSSVSPAPSSHSSTAIENLRSKISRHLDSPSASPSPVPSMSPIISNSALFLGICDEHPQGRAQGVECPKCDMILGSSQSLGGHMTMMHSRNSCKTLKCPKCNWHYKYQETLEIHMKEKHPEGDQQCVYCLSNQSHPRLSRGESYSCGYKPYRCEVCNYSTTTKGNLSIHMQSDKHLNNVQDLANGGGEMKLQAPPTPTQQQAPPQQQPLQQQSSVPEQQQQQSLSSNNDSLKKNNKPKPTWRCDVCNYETNVARNLRIHMTSEKHTHNMMVLQQNMKHMQRDMHIQQMNQLMLLQNDPAFITGYPNTLPATNMAFNLEQSMYGNAVPNSYGEIPMDLRKENGGMGVSFDPQTPDSSRLYNCCVCNTFVTDSLESLHQHLQVDRTKQRETETISVSQGTYICNLCSYKTNLKANFQLHCKTDKHLQRLQLVNHIKEGGPNNEWRLKYLNVSNPVQVRCNSCDYYTNSIHKLQIHSGNPRHEKNGQLFHFLQMGENKLKATSKYYHCTLCNFSTRAKLNMIQHVRTMKHLQNEQLKQMQMTEKGVTDIDPGEIFQVKEYSDADEDQIRFDEEDGEIDDEDTVTSSYENDIQDRLDQPATSKESSPENIETEKTPSESKDDQIHVCPYCDYSSSNEMRIQAHVISQHSQNDSKILCPLCQEDFKEKRCLEKHLMNTHSVKPEGLQRLLFMVDQGDWIMPPTSIPTMSPFMPIDESGEINTEALEAEAARLAAEDAIDTAALPDKNDTDDQYRCQTCSKTFSNIDGLYAHQNELGHLELKQTPRGPGYLCWKKGCNQYFKTAQALQVHFREIHAKRQPNVTDHLAYKYDCNQCSLAFKSPEKLQLHSHFHLIQAATRCSFCSRSFRSISALRKHIDTGHSDISESEREQYHASMNVASMALGAMLKQSGMENLAEMIGNVKTEGCTTTTVNSVTAPVVSTLQSEKLLAKTDMNSNETIDKMEEKMDVDNSSQDENEDDDENMDTSEREDMGDMPYKEQQFLEDYINSQAVAENSYEDPARKFKCHRCRLAFTKQTYLTAHNKTLLHRRGEKMSYPMEKYLDPNRPFKCDVCKESFTQKNILLVHYNSVSHLHKLKQITSGSPPSSTPENSENEKSETTNSLAAMNGDDKQFKPYKCNICKVSYSQGSTLDIHIRSVGHQTKASKLQELVLTGQVDIMQPLIEQPNDPQMSQQQKILSEMLAQQPLVSMTSSFNPLLFPGMPGLGDFGQFSFPPGLPLLLPKSSMPETITTSSTSTKSTTTIKTERIETNGDHEEMSGLHVLAQAAANNETVKREMAELGKDSIIGPTYLCQLCNAVFTNQDSLQQHQIICMYQAGCFNTPSPQMKPRGVMGRVKPQVHRNLLENIGFECVMQFNEFNNQPSSVRDDVKDKAENEDEIKKEIKEEKDTDSDKKEDLPELNKGVCPTCQKEFSSVWVLKAHQEEVHKEVVPTTFVEDFGEQFINDMDLKQAKESEALQTSQANEPSTPSTPSGESSAKEMPPPPPPPPPMMSPQIDISQMMPMFNLGMQLPVPMNMAMMNMQPQLMPMMFPVSASEGLTSPLTDPVFSGSSSKMSSAQQQAAAAAAMQNQNKRARTRINDEQLKVLRGYFDINNSPSEEQIIAMSDQSGLPTKVIKHWFRNTLFKERQRNKDSPYNFNNPPLTTLDLEEYEKTGKLPTSEDSIEVPIKKEPESMDDSPAIIKGLPKESPFTPTESKPNPPQIVSLPLLAPAPIKSELPPKSESPKLQDSMMDDSDSMSNSSAPTSTPYSSAPPPLVNINMSAALSFSNNGGEEIRPRFEFSPHHSSYNKRANRTRFTDYQIKVLQEYFEQNAYPKDDELDHLSKVLNLSPRVIVVWFQNARQKARKIYENQPNSEPVKETNSTSPFNRTPGLNYQCKKCTAVFQRYYDLIRHQKKHCSSDNDKSMSASTYNDDYDSDSLSSMSKDDLNQSEDGSMNSYELSGEPETSSGIKFNCEKCNKSFEKLDAWRDHQSIHMTTSLFSEIPTSSAFGVLQNMAAAQQQESDKMKRKFESYDDDDHDQTREKRLRTTILPEQLDYLYQKYQLDCNPSRKQLEHISRDVCLKKRVVQVWFQNTRARERKGQYRAHQQLIHKRCPFCRALFRAKSALESHLATKHPEEMAKGEINIDNIPDAALESPSDPASTPVTSMFTSTPTPPSTDFSKLISPQSMQSFLPILPSPGVMSGLPNDPLQMSMTKFYADSFKKYMSDLSANEPKGEEKPPLPSPIKAHESKPKSSVSKEEEEAPLDLSKPLKVKVEHEKTSEGPSTDQSENSNDIMNSSRHYEDSSSDVSMNKTEYYNSHMTTSGPNSPVLSSHSGSMAGNSHANKRYRTQMTSLQVRIMKTIFVDYKTPTMAECEMLGRIIGLQKRVVQVWFQNARAKEKKSKLQISKTYGTSPEIDFHKPPEECKLCNFTYSHKYTIQDHIFTKKHIENVRIYVQSQSEAESHITSQGMAGLTGSLSKSTERKQWEDSSAPSHLSQLQQMGMSSLGMPLSGLPGLGSSFNPTDLLKKEKDSSGDKKSTAASSKDSVNMDAAQLSAMMSSPFSGFFPGIDPSMLPYMYAGFPAYMPGMGMPFMPPGFMPGAEQMMGYDPMSFGTPLPLLQIPQQAIKDVSVKLSEPKATVAQYTQDCKSISSLKSLVNNVDYLCVCESTVDVGYICKKCQMVYPGKDACVGHQRSICFPGGKIPENISPMLKLEQIQYECKVCSDKSSTVQEYKIHCQSDGHKAKTVRLQQKTGKLNSSVSSVSPSPSKTPSSSNPSMSPLPKSDIGSPSYTRPKDNASNAN